MKHPDSRRRLCVQASPRPEAARQPDVRTFAQQVAHVADDQYNLCGPARGETRKAAYTDIEDRLSRKADLVPALKAAFAYCDGAYDALTDSSGAEPSAGGRQNRRVPAHEGAGAALQRKDAGNEDAVGFPEARP
jgi:hypothetical protein